MPFRPLDTNQTTSGFRPLGVTPSATPETTLSDKLNTGTENILKDIVGSEQNKSDAFIPSLLRSTVGSQGLAGVAQLPGKVAGAISEYGIGGVGGSNQAEGLNQKAGEVAKQAGDLFVQARSESDPVKKAKLIELAKNLQSSATQLSDSAKGISGFTDTTGGQALGTALNAGLTVATAGEGSLAKNLGLKGAKNLAARVGENAVIGAGFQVGQNLVDKKNVTDNLGTAAVIGGAIPVLGTAATKAKTAILNKVTPAAEVFINSLIKPLQKDFAYGKNPARGIINEGIVANNLNDLSQKVSGKITEVGGKIGEVGEKLNQSGQISLDLTPALAPIDEAIASAAKSNNQTLFHSLNNVKIALIHDLKVGVADGKPAIIQGDAKNLLTAGYNEAKQFLTDIAEHTRFTGNPSDDKALNMATKRAYGVTREIMNTSADKVDPKLGAEIRNLNERYGDLLSARSAINHRDIVLKRQNILSLADKFSIPVAVVSSMMTGFATGDWVKAGTLLAGEVGAILGTKALGSTASKTRIAQFLSKLAPEERQGILNSTPVLKNYYERITGQTTPEPGAPKTKTLQTVEEYLKNPKLGLSTNSVKPEAVNAAIFDHLPELQKAVEQAHLKGKSISMDDLNFIDNLKGQKIDDLTNADRTQVYEIAARASRQDIVDSINKQVAKPMINPPTFKQDPSTGRMAGSTASIPKDLEPLAKEAMKYKSAEEFVKSQKPVYHGSSVELKQFNNKQGTFFTDDYPDATGYAGNPDTVYEGYLVFKNPLIIDAKGAKWDQLKTPYGKSTREIVSNVKDKGYDGVVFKNIVDNVIDTAGQGKSNVSFAFKPKDAFLNESQLKDFYEKVKGKK